MNRKITFLLTLLFLGYFSNTKAQVSCPSNIDFELGNFTGWTLYTGSFTGPGTPTWTVSGVVAGRHAITSGTGTDTYGLFPVVAPGGGSYSAKLGANVTGSLAERATYTFTVPTTSGIWSLIYRYAVVLEDPGHPVAYQPKMVVTAFDNTTSSTVPCATYTYVSSTSVPGFSLSSVSVGGTYDVHYKPWTYGNMKFPGLGGHSVTVDFSAYDCGYGGHFGYGYVDMTCGFFANSVIGCASGTTILSGPDGFSSYAWYDSATFTTSYGSSEVISITSPTITTTYAVILTPFAGYGCPDTLYTRVVPSTLYVHPSNDTTICSGISVTLTAGATSASLPITYVWTPSSSLSCSTCASPVATPTVTTSYIVTATDGSSCTKTGTVNVTVVPTPCAIGGPSTVCPLASVTETDCATGGLWSSTPTTVGSIVPLSGSLTGVSSGTCTVVYTTGGICSVSKVVTVSTAPAPILPLNPHVCVGQTTTVTDATSGGVWSLTPAGTFASIGSGSGVVLGIFAGTGSTITYTAPSGCVAVSGLTVNPTPGGITGITTICVGSSSALFDITSGGTWSVTPTTVATVSPTSGVVYGASVGSATVTYTAATGCTTTVPISVVPLPSAISGPTNVCIGGTGVTYTDTTASGIWSVSNPAIAFVDPFGALTTYATGVDTIYYTSAISGCASSLTITIDPAPVVTGVPQVCVGQTTSLSSTGTGLTWTSSDTTKATVSPSGVVTGVSSGTVNITVTTVYGCSTVTPILVNGLPLPITGPASLCVGTTVVITDGTPGGTFSTAPVISASVTPTGTVSGLVVGLQTITYTAATTGCYRTRVETVNTTPAGITGVLQVCQGQTSCLSDIVPGGSWSVNPTTFGTIVPTTGCYTGITAGVDTVKYSLGAGCTATTLITVNALPGSILPASPNVCVGSTLAPTDPPGPGTWAASCPALSIGGTTGIVSGLSGGTCTVTYTQLSTGCTATKVVTVNSNPLPINPPSPTVCIAATTPLADGTGGGTWTVTPVTTATITPTTGVVYGVAAGSAAVKYTLPTGCFATSTVTVEPLPPLFTVGGTGSFCAGTAGLPITLSGSTAGVSYQLYLGVAPVGGAVAGTGGPLNFGLQTSGGTYTVVATYTTPATGCSRTMTGSATLTVNAPPATIVGSGGVCVASTITLTDATPGGTWHSSNPLAATCTAGPSSTTTVTGVTNGLSTVISYTLPTGCYITTTVNVTSSPGPILGVSSVCVGACTTLSDTVLSGLWSSGSTSVATVGTSSGSVCGVSAGTVVITYSLGSGCQRKDTMTVTAAPLPITGTHNMCVGDCDTFHDATIGGSWLMDPGSTGLGSIGAGTGVFCGTSVGVATISYAAAGGTGCGVSYAVSINPIPTPIAGPSQVCVGSCATYTSTPTGGAWSVSPGTYASVGATTGNLCGVTAGTSTILKYSAVGCAVTMPVTVNPLPAVITGPTHVCEAQNITLSSTSAGGTWTSSSSALASVIAGPSSTTVVTGAPATTGIATITYTLPTGCLRSTPITVNLTPAPISGNASLCQGHVSTLTDPTPGGSWSSSNPAVATIGATTGVVTAVVPGCVTISYTLGSCAVTFSLCVVAPPLPILGPITVCVGDAPIYTDASPGGTWLSSLPTIATIDPSTGMLTGVSSGTVIISYGTYGSSGCSVPKAVVVNPIGPILGNPVVCQFQTTHLIDTSLGGTWASSNPGVASVNPLTGVVTGVLPGSATITYLLPATGCHASIVVTVNAAPTITGGSQVCVGNFLGLTSTPAGGTWSSTAPLVGTVDPLLGIVNGLTAGSTIISYTLTGTTGCSIGNPVTVNSNPAAITGPNSVCVSHTITLSDVTPGGTWSSSLPLIASVDALGNVTAGSTTGTTIIMYTLGTSCAATKSVAVVNPPPPPTGTLTVCQGQTTTLTDPAGPGTWSSSASYVATVDPVTGVVTGNNPGTATITFAVGGGCSNTVVVTVNALPAGISPSSPNVCVASTVTLTDTYPGGSWSSSVPTYADIVSTTPTTAVVAGYSPGATVVTYQLPTGCATSVVVNVSAGVTPIGGIPSVCLGSTTALNDPTPGGVWSSSNSLVAPVDAFGNVSGLSLGTAIIYYNTGGSCVPSVVVTVNPLPAPITGSPNVCQGGTTVLSDAVPLGAWSSTSAGIATVSSTGVVTGVVTGFTTPQPATIVYMLGAGCDTTFTVMVNPVPANISGPSTVCVGQAITLSDLTPSGVWSSSDTTIGTVDIYGDVAGVHAGGVTISYTNSYSCAATANVSVNAMPTAITGNFNVCLGGNTTLHDSLAGGRWFSSATGVATIDSITGVVHGVTLGSATIIYIYHGSCFVTQPITVVPLPVIYTVTGGGNHCSADTGVHIGLSGSSVGVDYMVYLGSTAVGAYHGSGLALDLGLYTVGGVYTVIGTSTATGCSSTMAGSAAIGVIPSVTPSVNFTILPHDTVCAGATITITPSSVNGGASPSFVWSINSHPVALTPSYSYIPADGDTVSVAMTSSATCAHPAVVKKSEVVKVNPFAVPSVDLSISPDDTVCKGSVVTVTALPTYGGTAPYYMWFKNGAPMGSGSVLTYVPVDGDIVYATMNSNYPCRLANADTSNPLSIKVDTAKYPMVTILANPGTIIGVGQPDTLTAHVANAVNPTYQWYVNGVPVAGATTNRFVSSTFSYPKEDSVSVAVTNHDICTITAHEWVYIQLTSVGVQQINTGISDINVIPNPNKGEFVVKGSLGILNDEEVTIEMADVIGQVIYKTSVVAKNGKIDQGIKLPANVANGMYILSVHSASESKVFHVVIEQ